MNLKKAFDIINHEILQQKLELDGIYNKELKWICSYLAKKKNATL